MIKMKKMLNKEQVILQEISGISGTVKVL